MSHFATKLLLFSALVVVSAGCSFRPRQCAADQLVSAPVVATNELREGDIAFRRGVSMASGVVDAADREGVYSHTGVVVRVGEEWFVVHAVPGEPLPDGSEVVRCDPIGLFFAPDRCRAGALMRYADSCVAQRVAQTSLDYYLTKVAFDSQYDTDDSTQLYCTELIWRAFRREGVDIGGGRRHSIPGFDRHSVIFPSDIASDSGVVTLMHFEVAR